MERLAISMENVWFVRNGRAIIHNFSWQVEEGSHWILLGPNGSGKTTILKLIAGYLWPTEGVISVLGSEFGKIDLRVLRRQIGWVGSFLQEHIASEQTPMDIILSGAMGSLWLYEKPSKKSIALAESMADLVGCSHLLKTPYGVLSQGEKQRILLARALTAQPRLLLLDEPCAGLDMVAREHFLQVLSQLPVKLSHPITIVLVTHHIEEANQLFSKALLLKNGTVLGCGSIWDVLTDSMLSELYEAPIKSFSFNGRYYGYVVWNGIEPLRRR
ncbi:MAG: ATP-binding cassette domain-containing protein [Thermodesulforhabdaceae bacterium]